MPDEFEDEADAWVTLGEAVEIVMDDLRARLLGREAA
jgi:hypothetical protein